MSRTFHLKPVVIGAVVAVLALSTFAISRSTIAHGNKPPVKENALRQVPAVTGIDTSSSLQW